MDLVIVTGLSGAGKTQAIRCFEDLGYYCVDNIPPELVMNFVQLVQNSKSGYSQLALVIDVRGGEFFEGLKACLEKLKNSDLNVKLLFLEASSAVLLRRYKESRRTHPLSPDGNLQKGIQKEQEMLSFAREAATWVIDTSSLKAAQLRTQITNLIQSGKTENSFIVTVESFGFKFGMPQEADWILDVRFIPNPFYVPSLKHLTGKNKKVEEYVLKSEEAWPFIENTVNTVDKLIPSYTREGKYHLHIAIGCTGGRHRSVVIAIKIAEKLKEKGRQVVLLHRETN